METFMQTIVERSRTQIINFDLFLKIKAESITTIIYLRIRYLSLAIEDKKITLFQAWHKNNLQTINYIQIFCCTAYIFDKTKSKCNLASKTQTGYLIVYPQYHQYQIQVMQNKQFIFNIILSLTKMQLDQLQHYQYQTLLTI